MANIETVQLRIFGRDLTLSCPSDEKEQLLKSAALLNEELDKISDKQNALVIAGLSLANKGSICCVCASSRSPRSRQGTLSTYTLKGCLKGPSLLASTS